MGDDQFNNELEAGEGMGKLLLSRFFDEPEDSAIRDALEDWLREHPEVREAKELLTDLRQLQTELAVSRQLGKYREADFERLRSRISGAPVAENFRRRPRHYIYYLSTGVAAALLIAVCTLLLLKPSSLTNKQRPVATTGGDIQPGKSVATLTLANGQKILLDSAGSGLLVRQGNMQVIQSDGGQIQYQLDKPGASAVEYNTMTTPVGGTFKVTLSDGTKVWLNAGSTLRYPATFAGAPDRAVTLQGEAYFEVAANPSSPFYVRTGGLSVKVLGTHFNVMSYGDEERMETTLLEGAVAVSRGSETRVLHPGEQARVVVSKDSTDKRISVVDVDPEDYVAWKNGLIQMHDADIPTILRQISRWYDVKVTYQGNPLPTLELEGRIARTLTLSQVLKVLDLNGIHCKLEGRTVTVLQ